MQQTTILDLGAFEAIQSALTNRDYIAIDTEFMRERTFYAQLCLLQVATGDDILCIDPLSDHSAENLAAAWQTLLGLPWILHSGRQDIEVVYQTAGRMPAGIFDTQIAAGLLGYQPQIGYANLVADLFDVRLAKSHTRADWSRRPLPGELIEYAAEDVMYLLPAYQEMQQRLEALGRLHWARQDSADLLNSALYDINPNQAVDRLKGARNLQGPSRSISVRLAGWREKEAQRSNRPRQWIMPDKVLLEIAIRQPRSFDQLLAIEGISQRTVERASDALLEAVSTGLTNESSYEPPQRPDESQKKLLKTLQSRVAGCAESLGVATEIVAPKKELSAAIAGDRSSRVFSGWRGELIGSELLELLQN